MNTPGLGLYVAASLALIATPGQDMLYVIPRSCGRGSSPTSPPVKALVGFAAGSLSERLLRSPTALTQINQAAGLALIGLGLRLAATER